MIYSCSYIYKARCWFLFINRPQLKWLNCSHVYDLISVEKTWLNCFTTDCNEMSEISSRVILHFFLFGTSLCGIEETMDGGFKEGLIQSILFLTVINAWYTTPIIYHLLSHIRSEWQYWFKQEIRSNFQV